MLTKSREPLFKLEPSATTRSEAPFSSSALPSSDSAFEDLIVHYKRHVHEIANEGDRLEGVKRGRNGQLGLPDTGGPDFAHGLDRWPCQNDCMSM